MANPEDQLNRIRSVPPSLPPGEVPVEDGSGPSGGVLGGLRSAFGFGETGAEYDRSIQDLPEPQTQTSLGEQVDRWYEPVGGIGPVLRNALTRGAMNFGGLDRKRWPALTSEGVNRQQRIYRGDDYLADGIEEGEVGGYYRANSELENLLTGTRRPSRAGDFIHLLDEGSDNHMKEHELTHGALLGGPAGMDVGIGETSEENRGTFTQEGTPEFLLQRTSTGEVTDQSDYFSNPIEIDVRLAEIKRRYAYHTGVEVQTPEQAADALEWFNATREDRGRGDSMGHNFLDSLSPEQKQEIFHRMPELVFDGSLQRGAV